METAATVDAVREALAGKRFDVALIDARPVPAVAVKTMLELGPTVNVIALAIEEVAEQVLVWIEAGATGYVSSDLSLDELVLAIQAVARGELRCSASATSAMLRRLRGLAAAAPRDIDTYQLTPASTRSWT